MTKLRPVRAYFQRELRAALLNRFVHIFSAAALLAGLAPIFLDVASGDAAPYLLLQVTLYLVPLFALLIGAGSAQADQDERPFLFSQPTGRGAMVYGKFLALWLLLGLSVVLLVMPSALGDTALPPLGFLWFHAIGIAGIFIMLGLAAGFSTTDRVKAHLAALCLWLLFLAGFDLLALIFAHLEWAQQYPSLWSTLLMLNPLGALRVGVLFSVDQVPFDRNQAEPLVRWWLDHLGLWFTFLTAAWIALGLLWSRRSLERIST